MGNFTLKTDSYLNQFALFKGVNKLLKAYEDTPIDKVPSLPQLIANKLYHEWLDLANIISDLDNWTEDNWNNFNIGMSLAESCKNRVDSISYALQGLGWNFTEGDENEMITTSSGTTIKIKVGNISTSPRLDQIKSRLKRCIEYLILTKDPTIQFDIGNVDVKVEFSANSTSSDIISEKEGVLLEADVTQISTTITIHVFDSIGAEVSNIYSYEKPDLTHGSGYLRYDIKIKDEETGEFILDPALYRIHAVYQMGSSFIRIDSATIDNTGWTEDDPPYPSSDPNKPITQSYHKVITSAITTLDQSRNIVYNMTPASIIDELRMSEAEMFLSNVDDESVTLTCTHIPLESFNIKLMAYYPEEYEQYVNKFNVTLYSSDWNTSTMTIKVPCSEVTNIDDLIISSKIINPSILSICNTDEIRIDSVEDGFIIFRCNIIPSQDLIIPIETVNKVESDQYVPPIVSEENPIPSVYFDKDTMILWVAKGQGEMSYNLVDVIFKASHIYNGDIVEKQVTVTWKEIPE